MATITRRILQHSKRLGLRKSLLDRFDIRKILRNEQTHEVKKALVLAGGFGTRMKDLTKDVPKPMLPLHGKPILEYTIDLCRRYGIKDIGISIHYHGEQIKRYFGNGDKFGVRIVYLEEDVPLGTGGVLRLHKHWLNQTFLMCNADELKDINLATMFRQHAEKRALATIALTQVENPSEYGVVELQRERILRFVEKPKREDAPSNLINAGLYILDPAVTNLLPEGHCMVEKDLFPKLAEQGRLYGYEFKGQWFDTGTPERYNYANENWEGFRQPATA
jgi:NDP-sugar pyrophosphorylase family protein